MRAVLTCGAGALAAATAAAGVGFQRLTVADSDGVRREVGVWYPSDAPATPQPLGQMS